MIQAHCSNDTSLERQPSLAAGPRAVSVVFAFSNCRGKPAKVTGVDVDAVDVVASTPSQVAYKRARNCSALRVGARRLLVNGKIPFLHGLRCAERDSEGGSRMIRSFRVSRLLLRESLRARFRIHAARAHW